MTPGEALVLLEEQKCPIDRAETHLHMEFDEAGAHAYEACAGRHHHLWPYETFEEDSSTNYFHGDFDIEIIADLLNEYGADEVAA